jgi:hypothetical protein
VKIKRKLIFTLELNNQDLADIQAAINWTVTNPNSMPVEMNKRLLAILKDIREENSF